MDYSNIVLMQYYNNDYDRQSKELDSTFVDFVSMIRMLVQENGGGKRRKWREFRWIKYVFGIRVMGIVERE